MKTAWVAQSRVLLALGVVAFGGAWGFPADHTLLADTAGPEEESWQWVPESGGCERALSEADVRASLESAPPMIVGFEHRAALGMLRDLAVRVPCLDVPVTPQLLADLWYQVGMATLYTWDEAGELHGRGRAEVVHIFQKVRRLVPDYRWDTTSFGTFGKELWDSAAEEQGGADVEVALPRGRFPDAVWVDGQAILAGGHPVMVTPGTCLVQVRSGSRLSGRWWLVIPGSERPVLPVGVVGDGKTTPVVLSVLAGVWSMPLVYSGPTIHLRVPVRGSVDLSVGAGGARAMASGTGLWIVPLQAGLWWRPPGSRLRGSLGIGYQGYLGGGFGSAPGDTGDSAQATGWAFDEEAGWHLEATPFAAHGGALLGRVDLVLGPWCVQFRAAAGAVVWRGVMLAPQAHIAVGLGRRMGSEGS